MNKILSFVGALFLSVAASAQVVPFSISNDCGKNGQNVDLTDHRAVDLGLSVKWASMNVGANTPEDYGDYFAWGGTVGYGSDVNDGHLFDWYNCPFQTKKSNVWDNSYTRFTKYTGNDSYRYADPSATSADVLKTVLDRVDDAAYVNWGSSWRIPTKNQCDELYNNCTWTWTTLNGMSGYRVTGPNGNSIFLPAAGYRSDAELSGVGSHGSYWARSIPQGSIYYVEALCFDLDDVYSTCHAIRYHGNSVRPVFIGEDPFTLTVYADGCDTPNTLTCLPGTEVELTAEEDMDGYTFTQWSDGNTDNPRMVTMTDNITLTAVYGNIPAEYRRTTTSGNYGTICLPKGVAHENIQGGVFFNIVYAVTNTNMDITGILMEEETGDLVAGKPYIFRATADELVLPYTGEAVANPLDANGLVGNLSETPLNVPQNMYVLSNNQIRKLAGGSATAGQNRAYIDLTNVTKLNYVPSAAPNRVMLNVEGSDVATDLENIQSKDVQKIVRDGQLLIIRDGKTYNVLGITL